MSLDNFEQSTSSTSDLGLFDLMIPLVRNWRMIIVAPIGAGALAYGSTFLVDSIYTARTSLIPPQQQSGMASALSSLGAIAGLAGASSIRNQADQYVAFAQSRVVRDRIIDKFDLLHVYDVKYREQALKKLEKLVSVSVGKKDGLISIEVDDTDPVRAAAIANEHVEELRRLTSGLAVTEAQQRRVFFETQLKATQENLTKAQVALQASGISESTLKTEPKAAAEQYGRLRAELTAAEVRGKALRSSLTESAPEVQQQSALINALRALLQKAEQSERAEGGPSSERYVTRYREFKYQETLFELFARQFELAKADEARDGPLIQVVDVATPPERKSKPRRVVTALAAAVGTFFVLVLWLIMADRFRVARRDPAQNERWSALREAMRR